MNNVFTKKFWGRVALITGFLWILYYWLTSYFIGQAFLTDKRFYHFQDFNSYWFWIKYCIAKIGNFNSWQIQLPYFEPIPALSYGNTLHHYLSIVPLLNHISAKYISIYSVFYILPYYMAIAFVGAVAIVYKFSGQDISLARTKNLRGAKLINEKNLCRQLHNKHDRNFPALAAPPISLPFDLETRHVLTAGSTGSGKSVMLCSFINSMVERLSKYSDVKMLLYDRKGELTSKFYKDGDIIFNPYDERSPGWTIFNEFELLSGFEKIPEQLVNLSNSLFSVKASNEKHWYDGAASIFKSGCCYLKLHNQTTNKDLYNFFTQDSDKIRAAIESLPAGLHEGLAYLSGKGDTMASYTGCLINRVKAFQPFIGREGELSITKWIQDDSDKRKLILNTASSNDEVYLPIMTMLIDVVGHGLRDKPENKFRRVYFILDELSSLPPLKTLQMLLREGRSRGASVWLTTQTMASVEAKYGKNDSADIMGLCNTLFIFRTSEPGQSRYFSNAFGDAERVKINKNKGNSQRGFDIVGSKNNGESENRTIEKVVLPGELQGLPVGMAYVKVGDIPPAKVHFKNISIPNVAPYFIPLKQKIATKEEIDKVIGKVKPSVNPEKTEKNQSDDTVIIKM